MKTLKFRAFKARGVLDGTKTSTMRLFDDKDIQAGDDLELINYDTWQVFAQAKVKEVVEKKLKDLDEADFDGHEKFASQEEMYETYKKYYGDKVNPDTLVKIMRFELVEVK